MQLTGGWSWHQQHRGWFAPQESVTPAEKAARRRGSPRQLLPETAGGQSCCAAPGLGRATQDIVGAHRAIPASPGAASELMVMGMEHLKSSVRVPRSACTSSQSWPPSQLPGALPLWQLETKRKHFIIDTSTSVAILFHPILFFHLAVQFAVLICC